MTLRNLPANFFWILIFFSFIMQSAAAHEKSDPEWLVVRIDNVVLIRFPAMLHMFVVAKTLAERP